jgi:hypothetical protein
LAKCVTTLGNYVEGNAVQIDVRLLILCSQINSGNVLKLASWSVDLSINVTVKHVSLAVTERCFAVKRYEEKIY